MSFVVCGLKITCIEIHTRLSCMRTMVSGMYSGQSKYRKVWLLVIHSRGFRFHDINLPGHKVELKSEARHPETSPVDFYRSTR